MTRTVTPLLLGSGLFGVNGHLIAADPGFVLVDTGTVSLAARLPQADRFEPDRLLDEDTDLAEFGLARARVLLMGGHSAGSIALLPADGSLLCGDVLENRRKPRLGSIMDDVAVAEAGVRHLRTMGAGTVYPGHGRPFAFAEPAPPALVPCRRRAPRRSGPEAAPDQSAEMFPLASMV